MASLKTLKSKVSRRVRRRESRDVSKAFGEEPGTTVFTWEEPDTAGAFSAFDDAAALKRKNAHWPESLCAQVAEMAVCHVEPRENGDNVGEFYASIANTNSDTFAIIWNAYREAFEDKNGVAEGIESAKND